MGCRGILGWGVSACLALALAGCQGGSPAPARGLTVRVASYDFSENQVLAQVYGASLRRAGFRVDVIDGIGTREVVEPALEQGRVDVVVDYLGTMLDFLHPGDGRTKENAADVQAALQPLLARRGISTLGPARAEDQNGFVVTADVARRRGVHRLSDLVPMAASLRLGGPPECPTRRYCLPGLRRSYGLHFAAFRPMDTRDATVAALGSGEIDVGLLETTDARLAPGQLVLLLDDRGLQPRENVVPLVRTVTLNAGGRRLRAALDAVTSRLTTAQLIALNRAVEVDGRRNVDVAQEWVRNVPQGR